MLFFIIALVLIAIGSLCSACVKIVPQTYEYVIEFLGKYKTTWKAGLHFKLPVVEKIINKVTVKE